MRWNTSITLLSVGHACVDICQGAVTALLPFFIAERDYTYAVASGIVASPRGPKTPGRAPRPRPFDNCPVIAT